MKNILVKALNVVVAEWDLDGEELADFFAHINWNFGVDYIEDEGYFRISYSLYNALGEDAEVYGTKMDAIVSNLDLKELSYRYVINYYDSPEGVYPQAFFSLPQDSDDKQALASDAQKISEALKELNNESREKIEFQKKLDEIDPNLGLNTEEGGWSIYYDYKGEEANKIDRKLQSLEYEGLEYQGIDNDGDFYFWPQRGGEEEYLKDAKKISNAIREVTQSKYADEDQLKKLFEEVTQEISLDWSDSFWDYYDGYSGFFKGPEGINKQDVLDKDVLEDAEIKIGDTKVKIIANEDNEDRGNTVFVPLGDGKYFFSTWYQIYLENEKLPTSVTSDTIIEAFKSLEEDWVGEVKRQLGLSDYSPTKEELEEYAEIDKSEFEDVENSYSRMQRHIFQRQLNFLSKDEKIERLIQKDVGSAEAYNLIDSLDQDSLLQVENDAEDPKVRKLVIKKIEDIERLTDIVITDEEEIATLALENIPNTETDALKEIFKEIKDDDEKKTIKDQVIVKLEDLDDPKFWGDLAVDLWKEIEDDDEFLKDFGSTPAQIIVKNIKDEASLIKILDSKVPDYIQEIAVEGINDQKKLVEIATNVENMSRETQRKAAQKIESFDDLYVVIDSGDYGHKVALEKAKDLIKESDDKKFLQDLVLDKDLPNEDYVDDMKIQALGRVLKLGVDQDYLMEVWKDSELIGYSDVTRMMIPYLDNEKLLYDIATDDNYYSGIRRDALKNIKDQKIVEKTYLNTIDAVDLFDYDNPFNEESDQNFLKKVIDVAADDWLRAKAIPYYKEGDDEFYKGLLKKGSLDIGEESYVEALWKIKSEGNEEYFKSIYTPKLNFGDSYLEQDVYRRLIDGINDQEFLKQMVNTMPSAGEDTHFEKIAEKIEDKNSLKRLLFIKDFAANNQILKGMDEDFRLAFDVGKPITERMPAIKKLSPEDFMLLLKNTTLAGDMLVLVENITNEDILFKIASDPSNDKKLRWFATRNIKDLEKNKKLFDDNETAPQVSVNLARHHQDTLLENDAYQEFFIKSYLKNPALQKERGLKKMFAKVIYKAASVDNFDLLTLLPEPWLRQFNIQLPAYEKKVKQKDIGEKVPAHKQQLLRLLLTIARPA